MTDEETRVWKIVQDSVRKVLSEPRRRDEVARVLYDIRFPHRKWAAASLQEHELTMKQADAVMAYLRGDAANQD